MKFKPSIFLTAILFAFCGFIQNRSSLSAEEFLSVRSGVEGSELIFQTKPAPDKAPVPFAQITITADTKISRSANGAFLLSGKDFRLTVHQPESESSPFFRIDAEPISASGDKWIEKLPLPKLMLYISAGQSEALRAFGSGGLTPVDGHKGSYAFLGITTPENNRGVFAGWLTSNRGSGVFFSDIEEGCAAVTPQIDYGRLLVKQETADTETMVLGAFDDLRDGLEAYGDLLADWNHIKIKPAPTGYCSWYSNENGGCGTEETTAEFAAAAAEKLVPFGMNFFQIDDGWQLGNSQNGPNKNFTSHNPKGPYHSGMKKTADILQAAGLTTGIWFMPFSGNSDDPWFADKQDFFVRSAIDYPAPGEKNTRIYSNIDQKKDAPYETFWGGTCIDTTSSEAETYITQNVKRIANEWNCRYFKMDGLWTGAGIEQLYVNDEYLPDDIGKQIFHDPEVTNIEAYRRGMALIRKAAGDTVFILGCNVSQNMRVMSASIGYVDAMRIGPDNNSSWDGICTGPWRATNRYFYNGRVWWNDPDPVYVRDSIPLSHAQTITSWAALSGQLYAFSDWLPGLSEERVNLIRRTIPNHQKKRVRPVDLFQSDLAKIWILSDGTGESCKPFRYVAGIFNWNKEEDESFRVTAESLGIPESKEYAVYDFWGDRFLESTKNLPLDVTVPAASCLIASIRPIIDERPILLSTSRHITQGILEVDTEEWNASNQTLTISFDGSKAALTEDLPYQLRIWKPGDEEISTLSLTVEGKTIAKELQKTSEKTEAGTLYRVTLPRLTHEELSSGTAVLKLAF